MQAAYHAQRRRGVGNGQIIMNSRDLEELEDGTFDGARYALLGRLSRIRGAW